MAAEGEPLRSSRKRSTALYWSENSALRPRGVRGHHAHAPRTAPAPPPAFFSQAPSPVPNPLCHAPVPPTFPSPKFLTSAGPALASRAQSSPLSSPFLLPRGLLRVPVIPNPIPPSFPSPSQSLGLLPPTPKSFPSLLLQASLQPSPPFPGTPLPGPAHATPPRAWFPPSPTPAGSPYCLPPTLGKPVCRPAWSLGPRTEGESPRELSFGPSRVPLGRERDSSGTLPAALRTSALGHSAPKSVFLGHHCSHLARE
ncbi:uncharacterized protein LOC129677823 [Psammomys obesus]|uniref:uncharacterized protein LOC129677823 n=1 Tax=Psammomys obesus TaxID=48139 RepID=UPI00245330BA|nr:uncharacterized protein LOC129677823 [Psammomys obesus]